MPLQIQGQNVIIAPGTTQVTKQEVIDAIKQINPNVDVNALNIPDQINNPTVEQIAEWTDIANANASKYLEGLDYISTQFNTKPAASAASKEQVIANLKAQYQTDAAANQFKGGDINNSGKNPQIALLAQFLTDGGMDMLAEQFGRNDAAEIISQVFHTDVKINDKGQISIPYGHDDLSRKTFKALNEELFSEKFNSSPEIRALEDKLNQLTNNYNTNVGLLKSMQAKIENYTGKAEDIAANAKREADRIKKDYEAETQQKNNELETLKSNYKSGKITYEEFERKRQGLTLPDPDMSSVENLMGQADVQLENIDGCRQQITLLNAQNEALKVQIDDINAEIAIEKTKIEEQPGPVRTDPIGFTTADGARVDFMLDLDNNNALSNEQEFLGAQNGFADMAALDKDGNGIVDTGELTKAGVKVVVQDAGGQRVVNAAEYFKNGIQIDTKNYQELGQEQADGNLLAGRTTANIGGSTVEVTSTFDTLDYLDNKYNFTDADEGKGRFAQGAIKGLVQDPHITAAQFDGLVNGLKNTLNNTDGNIAAIANNMDGIKADFEAAKENAKASKPVDTQPSQIKQDPEKPAEKLSYDPLPNDLKPGAMGIKLKGDTYEARNAEINGLISKVKRGNYSPADTAKTLQLLREAARKNGAQTDDSKEEKFNDDFKAHEETIKETVEEKNKQYEKSRENSKIVYKEQDDLYVYDYKNKIEVQKIKR